MSKTITTVRVPLLIASLVLTFGVSYVYAWTAPTSAPTSGNALAPLTTGVAGTTQYVVAGSDICIQGTSKCLGGTTTITPPAGPTIVTTITASPATVPSGGSSSLSWKVTGTGTVTCTASGDWSGTKPTTGTAVSTGALAGGTGGKSYAFSLSCSDSTGTAALMTATVFAQPVVVAPPSITFWTTPATIQNGQTTNLVWTTTGATSCTASSGPWSGTKTISNTEPTTALSGPADVYYGITCQNSVGTPTTATTKVTVLAPGYATANNPGATGKTLTVPIPAGVTVITFNGYGGHGFQGGGCGDYGYPGAGGGGAVFAYAGSKPIIVLGGGGGANMGYCSGASIPVASSPTGISYAPQAHGSVGGTTDAGDGSGQGGQALGGYTSLGMPAPPKLGGNGAPSQGGPGAGDSTFPGGMGGYATANGSIGAGSTYYGMTLTYPGYSSANGGKGGDYGGGGGYGGGGAGGVGVEGCTDIFCTGTTLVRYASGGGGSYMAPGMSGPSATGRSIKLSDLDLTAPTTITLTAAPDGLSYNGNRGPGGSLTVSW